MSPAEPTLDELHFAAIRLDLPALIRSKHPGAVHFAGVLQLHPRHLNYRSQLSNMLQSDDSIEADDSALFYCAEALRLTLIGERDQGTLTLASREGYYTEPSERMLLLLTRAWLGSDSHLIGEANAFAATHGSVFPRDIHARIALQLMTWTRAITGVEDAATYYDLALRRSSGDLRKAIQSVGVDFGRESIVYFETFKARLVRYESILDLAAAGTGRAVAKIAQQRIESPFVRRIGGSLSTVPEDIVAAELQAEWCGAYWVLKSVWRRKANVVVAASNDPDELTAAVADWVLSGETNLRSVIDTLERHLDSNRIERLLHDHLLDGKRLRAQTWIELCDTMSGLLPEPVVQSLIRTLPLSGPLEDLETRPGVERSFDLFARLLVHQPSEWETRFLDLPPDAQLAVSARIRERHAGLLSEGTGTMVCQLLLAAMTEGPELNASAVLTVAYLVEHNPQCADDRERFMTVLPSEFSTLVALNYSRFKQAELIRRHQHELVRRLVSELESNAQGRWAGYASSLPLEIAQTEIALGESSPDAIDALRKTVESQVASSDSVLDALKALIWLLDEKILNVGESAPWISSIRYKSTSTAPVSMWTGRDDVRAINAVLANLKLRVGSNASEPITRLAFAARDPDVSVRLAATENLRSYTASSFQLDPEHRPVFDSIALGAVFDPNSRVQANGVTLIRGIHDATIRELAWARVTEEWGRSHTRVRFAAVHTAAYISGHENELTDRAAADRAVVVRRAALTTAEKPA